MRSPTIPLLALLMSAALTSRSDAPAVRHIEAGAVKRAFERGAPLVETAAYKVNASRRDAPGEAEIHTRDTDIFHLLEGSARFVTGGEISGARETAPNEVRGAAIEGGEERRIAKGDVIVVPAGIPHWFKSVEPPFVYYVVKVTE